MELPEWAGRARRVERPVLEVGFLVWTDFYYGPENDFSAEQWQSLREPLYQPRVEMHHSHVDLVFTSALDGSASELVRHYRNVLRLAEEHARPPARSHFWLRPFILSAGEPEVPFDWHDTREDAEALLSDLEKPVEGELFHDLDQGWEVEVFASGDRLFIRYANFDTQEELACFCCDRAALVRQVAPLRVRLDAILAELRMALGADYWSRKAHSHG